MGLSPLSDNTIIHPIAPYVNTFLMNIFLHFLIVFLPILQEKLQVVFIVHLFKISLENTYFHKFSDEHMNKCSYEGVVKTINICLYFQKPLRRFICTLTAKIKIPSHCQKFAPQPTKKFIKLFTSRLISYTLFINIKPPPNTPI